MSKKITKIITGMFITILLACSSNLISQSGWYPLQSGTNNILNSIYFADQFTGYMAGNGIMLKTLNGGVNWLVISESFGGTSVDFLDNNTGYVCEGTIYKTTDGGISWSNLNQTSLNAVNFYDVNTGYAVGLNSKIVKTTDGGITWEEQFVSLYYNKFNSVHFVNPQTGFVAGGKMSAPFEGMLYKTLNGGLSWYEVSPSALDIDFRSIIFTSKDIGYVVGGYEYGSSGVIYKSTNGGESFTQLGIINKDLNAVHFLTLNTGYAVGEDGTIIKTTDGSLSWTSQQSSTTQDLNSIYFLRANIGYSAGKTGAVQKTVNGGTPGPPFAIAGRVKYANGQSVTAGIVKALKYNSFSNTVIVVDTAPVESNGNYILRNIPLQDSVDVMVFANDEDEDNPVPPAFVPTYYAGNNNGTINWASSQTLYLTGNMFNVDIQVFAITGSGGTGIISGGVFVAPPNVIGLKDAIVYAMIGNEFKGYSVSRTGSPYDVNNIPQGSYHMVCDRMGYQTAQRDVILGSVNLDTINFYLTGIGVIGIQQNGNNIPSVFKLQQNYPNPFNPSTVIKFDIPSSAGNDRIVKLAVYDMLGKEIEILVNQQLKAGSYQLSWNASKYSSGIYFYKVFSNDFSDTKKMILVK